MTQQTCFTNYIRDDLVKYRKASMVTTPMITNRIHESKLKATALQTLLGEIERSCKRTYRRDANMEAIYDPYKDDDIYAVIRKTAKNWRESMKLRPDPDLLIQTEAIEEYLPAQLDGFQLANIARDHQDFPMFMRHLKVYYPSRYDGKQAKTVHDQVWQKNV